VISQIILGAREHLTGEFVISTFTGLCTEKSAKSINPNVTRDQVHNVMTDLDPEGLEARGGIRAKKKRKKGKFYYKMIQLGSLPRRPG